MGDFYVISGETLRDISTLIKWKAGLDTDKTIPFSEVGRALLNLESGIYKELFEKKVTQENITLNWSGVPPYSFSYVEGIDSLTFTSPYLTVDEGAFKGIQLKNLNFVRSEEQTKWMPHTFEDAKIEDWRLEFNRSIGCYGEASFRNANIYISGKKGLSVNQVEKEAFKGAQISFEYNSMNFVLSDEVYFEEGSFEDFHVNSITIEFNFPESMVTKKDAFKNCTTDELFVIYTDTEFFLKLMLENGFQNKEDSIFNIQAKTVSDNSWHWFYIPSDVKIAKKYACYNFPFRDKDEQQAYAASTLMMDSEIEEIEEMAFHKATLELLELPCIKKIGTKAFAEAFYNEQDGDSNIQLGSEGNPVYSIASDAFLNIFLNEVNTLCIYYDNRITSKEDIPEDYDYEFLDGKWVPSGSTTLWGIGPEYIDTLNFEWVPAFQEEG